MKNIGDTLKRLREENGLTRKEAADKLKKLGIDISDKTLYGYESGRNSANADMFLSLCKIYKCNNIMETFSETVEDILFTNNEWDMVEQYRALDPIGQSHVDSVLDWETTRLSSLKEKDERIAELQAAPATIIELSSHSGSRHLAEYFHDASAGAGIFILGNEAAARIAISDSDWDERTDYVIRVNGDSMEPDYKDGDNVMVSQHMELDYGDIGIFIVNGKAYIKEYGETELISRNPDYPNIIVHEADNIVCMGKVIGKLEGKYEIISN